MPSLLFAPVPATSDGTAMHGTDQQMHEPPESGVVVGIGWDNGGLRFRVAGELDWSTAPVVAAAWATVDDFPGRLQADLRAVTFCNLSGARVVAGIIAVCQDAHRDTQVILSAQVRWVVGCLGRAAAPTVLGRSGHHHG